MSDKPPPVSPKLQSASDKSVASETLLNAKIMEFTGYAQGGSASGMLAAREQAHEFLDARLDAVAEMFTEFKASRK